MASPVDTSVKHFLSTMAGAPVLSGTVGSGIAWLDALLVNGFDTKTLSALTVAGGVATAAFTGSHSAILDSVIAVAGVSGGPSGFAGLNGEQKVTGRPTTNTLTFATAATDGTYTGTITIKMAPLGFTKLFSKTNVAVYKSSDPASNGMCLRVDDTNAQWMRVIGYETMTDVDTGTGLFPTTAQVNGGAYWHRSVSANAIAVGWAFAGDSRTFYHSIRSGLSQGAGYDMGTIWGFGDLVALRPSGDAFATFIAGSFTGTTTSVDNCLGNNGSSQIAVPRSFTGLGSAVLGYPQHWGGSSGSLYYSGATALHGGFPNRVDGAMYMAKEFWTGAGTVEPRGEFPGLYRVLQSGLYNFFKTGDRAPATGALTGRNLAAFTCPASATTKNNNSDSSNTGIAFFDVTGPWR
ncbi:hypothetical protein [Variovorax paradoxus]|uniref:hypothetical protein n=1 Tax=Variovorax paradoxus TaxID=34073 RepID=UPI001933927F|nr:hypothetical protein INQ48_24995 [Variovorax paradoxus]